MTQIKQIETRGLGILERHTQWGAPRSTGLYNRRLLVWKNFQGKTSSCQVLVVLDGQNLFRNGPEQQFASWDGEDCFSMATEPLLVVAVPASRRRYQEYVGWSREPGHYSISGEKHAEFLVGSVLNYIERSYPESRLAGMIGASAGGVAALYTAWRYPHLFPALACLSAGRHYFQELLALFPKIPSQRIYLSCGDQGMDCEFILANAQFTQSLLARGGQVRLELHSGDHSETTWSARLPKVLRYFGVSLGEPKTESILSEKELAL